MMMKFDRATAQGFLKENDYIFSLILIRLMRYFPWDGMIFSINAALIIYYSRGYIWYCVRATCAPEYINVDFAAHLKQSYFIYYLYTLNKQKFLCFCITYFI